MIGSNWKCLLGALALMCGSAAAAQETRTAAKDQPPAPATLADISWVIGQWSGEGIGGAPAHESWLPPIGTTMVGTFVQEDGESGIQFTEHMYLMEEEGSLVMRLKHFNADMTGWEEKDGMVTFRLIEIEHCKAYFRSLTLRCTTEEEGAGGLIVAVKMQGGGELNFNFKRRLAHRGGVICPDAMNTPDMNACAAAMLARSEKRHSEYLAAAVAKNDYDEAVAPMIAEADVAFMAYRDAECAALYESFGGGTVRTMMVILCKADQTDARTHTIWENWLTYADSTPSMLPEPGPTN